MDAQVWVFSHVSVTTSVQMWYGVQYGCACVYTRDCGCQHAIVVVCLQFQLHQNAFVFVFVFVHAYLMCYDAKKSPERSSRFFPLQFHPKTTFKRVSYLN